MDMNDMMQQAQRMQLELARAQEEIKSMTYTATSGGGMVQVTANGSGQIDSIQINPEAVSDAVRNGAPSKIPPKYLSV